MSVTRTAISLPSDLFEQTNQAAQALNLSRSGVIALALQEFMERRKKQQIAEAIRLAYQGDPQEEEREVAEVYRRAARRHLEIDEW